MPAVVLTTENEVNEISSIGSLNVDSDKDGRRLLYKIFSRHFTLSRIFLNVAILHKEWWAYPKYSPPEVSITNFALDNGGLFYLNAWEDAASALEMAVISAKNAALLVRKNMLKTECYRQEVVTKHDNKHVDL